MKNIIKKVLSATVLTSMLFSLTACNTENNTQNEESDKLKIGIVQLIDNGAFEEMREGFVTELEAKGYGEDKVEIIYKNAQGDATNLNTICQEMVDSQMDVVAAIATPAAQSMISMESDIPVIFISVGNPVGAGIITDMEHPDKNATGTSNAIPIHEIFELSDKLTPGMQTYGILYCTNEVNSVTTAQNAKTYLTERGLNYIEKIVTNSSEVQQAAQSLVGDVDAIFIPNDSVIQAAMPLVAEVARDAQIPVYGSSAVMVNSGAFATVAITDTEIGAISADMAVEYLEGKSISDIPALVVPANTIVVNEDTANTLNITLTDEQKAEITFVHDNA